MSDSPNSTQVLLDALGCGAAIVTRDGRVVRANLRLCEMLGQLRQTFVGTNLLNLYTDGSDREKLAEILAGHDEEFFLPRADGNRVPVIESVKQIVGEENLLMTVVDISRQTDLHKALEEHFSYVVKVSDSALQKALDLKDDNVLLEQKVKERTAELHAAHMDAIYMLAVAAEVKDMDTGAHVRRIQAYSRALALQIGMKEDEAEKIGHSAILHDIGKIHIPDQILNKPSSLTRDERLVMQEHTIFGEKILSPRPFFEMSRQIARSHHENYDGSGYPDGLARDDIPLAARIVHVTDVYDALASKRVYKEPWPADRAADALLRLKGKMFDPELATAFHSLVTAGQLPPKT